MVFNKENDENRRHSGRDDERRSFGRRDDGRGSAETGRSVRRAYGDGERRDSGDRRDSRDNRENRGGFARRDDRRDDRRGDDDRRESRGGFVRRDDRRGDDDRRGFVRRDDRRSDDDRRSSFVRRDDRRSDNDRRDSGDNRERRGGFVRRDDRRDGDDRRESRDRRDGFARRDDDFRPRRRSYDSPISDEERRALSEKHYSKKKLLEHNVKNMTANSELRLNRYISMGGVCSRRDADELIKTGRVFVNGEKITEVGIKVKKGDLVEVDGKVVIPERKIYLVLNKPKDYVTTVEDPLERKTVMSLISGACDERIYPVGRLDRQTTGVLLFTNDGDLAKKLTHPSFDHKKIYHVFLDKPLEEQHLQEIENGITLEDGDIKADEINYVSDDRTQIGIEIHSGKNRVVRRIFEHFGYQILKLDRVYFSGITKKNLPRGRWRFLTPDEVNMLKVY